MAPPTTSSTTPAAAAAKPKAGRFKRALRRCYKVITSHLGLIVFLVAFSFLGAAIFQAIEGGNEKEEKANIQWIREHVIDEVWNTTPAVKRNEQAFRLLLRQEMKKYETQLYAAFADGINTSSDDEIWDFWGSLFYCATVYTTIGYGNIYPVTDVGRVVTIIYSLIGIPLCLIVLADLGKLFTRAIKWVWSFIRRYYHTRKCSRVAARRAAGEKAKQTAGKKDTAKTDRVSVVEEVPVVPVYVVDDEFNLPVSVAVILTFIYILLGALVYCQWEEWSYLESFYFVFISISTIGFGDVLPDHPKYFLLSSVYVLVGLSLVAMVINVIMEAMTVHIDTAQKNIAEIARTVGISIQEEDESSLTSQNGTVTKATTVSTTSAAASTASTPTTPRDAAYSSQTPSPRDDQRYGGGPPLPQDYRREQYGRPEEYRGREPPQDYRGRDPQDHRGREPYDYRGREPPQDYRGRPDDHRGPPQDYRGPPQDYRGQPGPRSQDPRMGDPRGPRSPQGHGPQQGYVS